MTNNLSSDASKALLAEMSKELPQLSKIEQYVAQGSDINYQSEADGYTALMLAVDRDDEPLVNYLLQNGANPLIQNHQKEIASNIALTHSPIYQLLKNYELLAATAANDIAGVKTALAAGANINFQGQGGYCAILIAVEQSCLEIVELLMVSGADLSLRTNDRHGVFSLVKDDFIYKTLDYGKPFNEEQKRKLSEPEEEDEERFEKGRLKTLAERKGQQFSLTQLKISESSPAASKEQLTALEKHFGHPLPHLLREIFTYYNGGEPELRYFGEEGKRTLHYFYVLNEHKDYFANVWYVIRAFSNYLGLHSLPFAEDNYGGIYYLKWSEGKEQVWLFQYGDQPFASEDSDEMDEEKMPYTHSQITNSLNQFLEGLYEIKG
jgi:hypothetical protein